MRHAQRGAALLVVLVVLGVLLVASVSLVQSSSTVSLIAGNTAFRQAAVQASDAGLVQAEAFVTALGDPETTVASRYFAFEQPTDAKGLPRVDWNAVARSPVGAYEVQYVVERMCRGVGPVVDPAISCITRNTSSAQSSQRAGSAQFTGRLAIYYRATVRVIGPRGTTAFVQTVVSR